MFSSKTDAEKKKEEKEKKKEQEKKEAEKKKKEEEKKKEEDEKKKEEEKTKEKDEPKDVDSLFEYYANFGDSSESGNILAKNVKKWLKQANLLDEQLGISEEEVQAAFEKVAKGQERLDKSGFKQFITTLSDDTKISQKELQTNLVEAGKPRVTNVKDLASKMMG